ncbi:MAG: Bax inhibitor-1/YccA family protein [Anaerolineae bacterium]
MGFFSFANDDAQSRAFPAGLDLSAIMRQVYMWLAIGLAVCFGIAYLIGAPVRAALESGNIRALEQALSSSIIGNPAVSIISLIVYIGMAFAFYPVVMRAKPAIGAALFLAFTAVFGVMLSTAMIAYAQTDVMLAFLATSGMFGAMTFIGLTTKADLSKLGSILTMAVIGLLIASVINIFARSEAIMWIITYAGVIIFTGFTAYDTWWIKNNAAQIAQSGDSLAGQRIALIGAFRLFLDFVNLFIYLLRIIGASRD